MKVRIKSLGLSKAAYGQQANYGLSLSSPGSASAIRSSEHMMKPGLKPKKTITGVDRDKATLEAEGGETVVGQISGDGIVDHMTIKGPRHSDGGVPLDLPEDSFIFSDTRAMKINDPNILQMFGKKPKKGGYTPAELAKPYDISKYKAILMDPDTDRLSRNTAEIMIKNIVMKLGALALAQEAKKGFPQGIPEIAKPYMLANGISEEDLMPELKAQAEQMQAMQQQRAMQMQQAQAMQQQAPQGMPPMMPSGQPAAMPQQGMAPPQQPMMDPRQMMAMQQEQQMMPPQPQQGMPMAKYGIQKFAPGGEPCPPGMYYHPTEGCIPFISPSLDTPDWTDDYKRSNRVIKSIQNKYNPPLNTPLLKQKYKDNYLEYPKEWDDPNFIGPINEIDENTLRRMRELQGYDIKRVMDWMQYNDLPPEFIPDVLEEMKDYKPRQWEEEKGNFIEIDGEKIKFRDSKNDPAKLNNILRDFNKEYEDNIKDCPCRERILVQGVEKEKCVPCESQPMAAYGMQLGGYDMPFIMGTGGMMQYEGGGETVTLPDGRVVPSTSTEALTYENRGVETSGGHEAAWEETITPPEREREGPSEVRGAGTTPSSGWEDSICDMIKNGATWPELTDPAVAPGGKTHLNPNSPAAQALWERCKPDESVFEGTSTVVAHHVIPPDDEEVEYCYCRDENGNAIEGTKILRSELGEDEDGNPIECESIEFKQKYCTETYDEIIDEELKEEEGILPLPLMPMFKSRVPGQDKTPPPLRGRLDLALDDYRTALQTDQGMLEKNVEAIRNSNMPYGMKAAAIAQVMSQSKGSDIVSGVYRDNVNRMNDLYAKEAGLEQAYDQLRYQGDLAYDQAEGQRRQQQLATDNAQAQYMADYAKDVWRTQLMAGAIGTENYDWRSRFRPSDRRFDPAAGTMSYTDYKASYCEGKTEAECRAAFQAEMSSGDPNVAKYGKAVTPYVMASSVYPFLI